MLVRNFTQKQLHYVQVFSTVYGIGKAACDRMAADCAHELKKSNVAMVSLWPGPVKTEFITENVIQKPKGKIIENDNTYKCMYFERFVPNTIDFIFAKLTENASKGELQNAQMFESLGETMEFAGMAVSHLAMDPKKMDKSGRILMTCDLAREYGYKDLDGTLHDLRSVSLQLNANGHPWLAALVPGFVRVPLTILHLGGNKF